MRKRHLSHFRVGLFQLIGDHLAVGVRRCSDIRMAYELLLHRYRCSVGVEPRSVAVPHRVCAELLDTGLPRRCLERQPANASLRRRTSQPLNFKGVSFREIREDEIQKQEHNDSTEDTDKSIRCVDGSFTRIEGTQRRQQRLEGVLFCNLRDALSRRRSQCERNVFACIRQFRFDAANVGREREERKPAAHPL